MSDTANAGRGDRAGAGDPEYDYEEFDLAGTTVTMISDPGNRRAWLQSNLTVPVER